MTDFVDKHRGELLTLLAKDGDVRRSAVAAFKPFLAGATTTTDVLDRLITKIDLKRVDKLAREVSSKSSGKLKTGMKMLMALTTRAEGQTLAKILQIKL